jgi:hypothetical protein
MQADVERLMARLVTERALRERFVADARGVAQREGLAPDEADAMARVPIADLLTAARSYEYKRAAKPRRRGWSLLSWWRSRRSA